MLRQCEMTHHRRVGYYVNRRKEIARQIIESGYPSLWGHADNEQPEAVITKGLPINYAIAIC